MKPNFKTMTRKELCAYIKNNRTDDEAINELFINRSDPNSIKYPANQTGEEIEQILREGSRIDKRQAES